MLASRAMAAVVAALVALCLLAVPSAAQTCSGAAVSVGPPSVPSYDYYITFTTLFASQRTLNVTTQVRQLQMYVVYTVAANNTSPINVSLALYAFQPCNGFGEAVLLAVTQSYTFPANSLTNVSRYLLTLSLPTPLIVPAGVYYVSMDDNSPSLAPLFGESLAGSVILSDVYTANTYNQSAPVAFPASTLFIPALGYYDTEATIIGTQCSGGEVSATFPTCNPRLFGSFPSTYNASSLPCAASSQVIGGSEYDPTYTASLPLLADVVRLTPSTITQTQTLYAVSFIASPRTNNTHDYTMRPAVYVQGANSSTFNLIAQAAQTTIPGSTFAGNFVELFFPLLTPVNVTAGQTVYINRLVDQTGLVLLLSLSSAGTLASSTTVTSAQSAPAVLTTQGTASQDTAHATFGCAVLQPAPASSSAVPVVGVSSSASGVSSSAASPSSAQASGVSSSTGTATGTAVVVGASSSSARGVSSSAGSSSSQVVGVPSSTGTAASAATGTAITGTAVVSRVSSTSSSAAAAATAVSASPASSSSNVVRPSSSSGVSNPGGNPGGNGASVGAVSGVVTLALAFLAVSALFL